MTLLHPKVEPTHVDEPDVEVLIREARRLRRRRWMGGATIAVLVAAAGGTAWSLTSGRIGPSFVTAQMTPAGFLALARSGSNGTFEATYQVSGGPSRNGTVAVVAQRAAAHSIAWPDRAGSSWSYRFLTTTGMSAQWIEQGAIARDCWRKSGASAWTCSGPGSYEASNGFDIATEAFIPGTVLQEISDAVDDIGHPFGVRYRVRTDSATNRSFGTLSCLSVTGSVVPTGPTTFCLDNRGMLVSVRELLADFSSGRGSHS